MRRVWKQRVTGVNQRATLQGTNKEESAEKEECEIKRKVIISNETPSEEASTFATY